MSHGTSAVQRGQAPLRTELGASAPARAGDSAADGESAPAQAWPPLSHETVPTPIPLGDPVATLDVSEFLTREFLPREIMFAPWLPTQGIAMIHAERGIGKTHVALGTAWAIHVGAGFLRWTAPQPRRVLLLDGEMPAVVLKERLARIAEVSEHPVRRRNGFIPRWSRTTTSSLWTTFRRCAG